MATELVLKRKKRRSKRPILVRASEKALGLPLTESDLTGMLNVSLGAARLARLRNAAMLVSCRPPYVPVSYSAVVRKALDEYLPKLEATIALAPDGSKRKKPCEIVESDIMGGPTFCATCGYRWPGEPTSCPLSEE